MTYYCSEKLVKKYNLDSLPKLFQRIKIVAYWNVVPFITKDESGYKLDKNHLPKKMKNMIY